MNSLRWSSKTCSDLLGPAEGPEEELDQREDHAYGRYLVGLLAPQSAVVEGVTMDSLGTDGADDPEAGEEAQR